MARRIGYFITAVAAVGGVIMTVSAPVGGVGQGNDTTGASGCVRRFDATSADAVRADGTTQPPQPNDGMARAYHYDDLDPGVREIVPPQGWRPTSASDEELRTYGFPPRPSDPAALQRWQQDMSKWRSAGAHEMCQTSSSSNLTNGNQETINVAGGMGVNGSATLDTYWDVTGIWNQTAFDAVCPGASEYSTWVGLGGFNKHRLIQAGTDAYSASINDIHMFWEVLNTNHDSGERAWTEVIPPGDAIEGYAYHQSGWASMFVYDTSTGLSHSVGLNSWSGESIDNYYDGTTVEYATESPRGGPGPLGYYWLRKPHLGNTYFAYAVANGSTPIANFPSWNLHQRKAGVLMQGSYFDGIHAWTNPWYSCG